MKKIYPADRSALTQMETGWREPEASSLINREIESISRAISSQHLDAENHLSQSICGTSSLFEWNTSIESNEDGDDATTSDDDDSQGDVTPVKSSVLKPRNEKVTPQIGKRRRFRGGNGLVEARLAQQAVYKKHSMGFWIPVTGKKKNTEDKENDSENVVSLEEMLMRTPARTYLGTLTEKSNDAIKSEPPEEQDDLNRTIQDSDQVRKPDDSNKVVKLLEKLAASQKSSSSCDFDTTTSDVSVFVCPDCSAEFNTHKKMFTHYSKEHEPLKILTASVSDVKSLKRFLEKFRERCVPNVVYGTGEDVAFYIYEKNVCEEGSSCPAFLEALSLDDDSYLLRYCSEHTHLEESKDQATTSGLIKEILEAYHEEQQKQASRFNDLEGIVKQQADTIVSLTRKYDEILKRLPNSKIASKRKLLYSSPMFNSKKAKTFKFE